MNWKLEFRDWVKQTSWHPSFAAAYEDLSTAEEKAKRLERVAPHLEYRVVQASKLQSP